MVLIDFDPARQFEAGSKRPAVVVSNNLANAVTSVIIVVPLTTNPARVYPHETVLPVNRSGLEFDSKTQPHLIRHVSVSRVEKVLSGVPDDLMTEIDGRLREHLAL